MQRSPSRRAAVGLLAAISLIGAAPAASATTPPPQAAQVAKTCGSRVHAVIGGAEKCLQRGQFCARASDRQYRRYGFHCYKRDARGNYHLT